MEINATTIANELAHASEIEDQAPVGSDLANSAAERAVALEGLLKHTPPASLDECLTVLAVAATLCDPGSVPFSEETEARNRADVSRNQRGVIAHLVSAGAKTPLWPCYIKGMSFEDIATH